MVDWLAARGLRGYSDEMPEQSRYKTAEVCLKGHPTTDDVEDSPERTAKFCSTCGSQTIRECPECKAPLRGRHYVPGVGVVSKYVAPAHCYSCGVAFPWTRARLEAAKEQAAEIEGLDAAEVAQLQDAIDDLATGGPRTDLGVSRFKRLMKKVGEAAGGGFYKVVVDVASEAAKKILLGG